jgi:hypothetical protein
MLFSGTIFLFHYDLLVKLIHNLVKIYDQLCFFIHPWALADQADFVESVKHRQCTQYGLSTAQKKFIFHENIQKDILLFI